MIIDNEGNPLPFFEAGKPWGTGNYHESADIHEIMAYAVAVALHRGISVEVRRVVPTVGGTEKFALCSVTPNNIDFRKVKAETALGMKAFASDLIANIEESAPPPEKEGFSR